MPAKQNMNGDEIIKDFRVLVSKKMAQSYQNILQTRKTDRACFIDYLYDFVEAVLFLNLVYFPQKCSQ
jgi:hypothetical protein